MTSFQKSVVAFLLVVAVLLMFVLSTEVWRDYEAWVSRPLGAPLPTSPYTPIGLPPTWTPAITPYVYLHKTLTPFPTNTPFTLAKCGGPRIMTILLIGSDTRGTSYIYGLSDVMRLVRIDFVTSRVTSLEIPRDLWVEIPEIADNLNGQDHEKLNQAYLYGNPGDGFKYWDDPSAGPGLLARTLDLNFGVKVDHYITVNMKTFVNMVDAVGGIDVNLERPVDGSDDPALQKGKHHLNGAQALALARNRTDGVFSRADNQNIVLCALQKKLADPQVVTKIPKLVGAFKDSVQTDLSPELMSQLACLAPQVPRDNITFTSFPPDLFIGTRVYDPVFKKDVFVWEVDFNILKNYVYEFQAGTWPIRLPGTKAFEETSSLCK